MPEEGSEEFVEGLASDLGINKTVVKEFGTDSFANFLLGAMGGGVAGAYSGAVAKKNVAQTPPIPPAGAVPPAVTTTVEEVTPAVTPTVAPTITPTTPLPTVATPVEAPVTPIPSTSAVLNEADIEPEIPETPVVPVTTAPAAAPVAVDAARIQELKNSIAEGEMIAKSGKKTDGTKMSKGELGAVIRSIENAKIKLNELEAAPVPKVTPTAPAADPIGKTGLSCQ